MMQISKWSDGKRFLAEDICVYSATLIVVCLWDLVVNFAISVSLYNPPHEAVHPYSFGTGQVIVAVACLIQLVRKIKDFQYYK